MPAPTGEESCDDAVAPKRSRRRRPSGRSAHHQRPFGRGPGQTERGDQGDPEGLVRRDRTGTTGDEKQLSPTGQRAPPPALLPRGIRRSTGFRSARRGQSNRRPSNDLVAIGPRCWSVRAAVSTTSDQFGEKLTARRVLWSPCPTHSRTDDRPAKACRKPRLWHLRPRLNETRTNAMIPLHFVKRGANDSIS